jgi:hypothetical protein
MAFALRDSHNSTATCGPTQNCFNSKRVMVIKMNGDDMTLGPWDDSSLGRRNVIKWYLEDPSELVKAAKGYLGNICKCDQGIDESKTITAKDLSKLLRVQDSAWNWASINIYRNAPEEITEKTIERMTRWFVDVRKECLQDAAPYIYYSGHLDELSRLATKIKESTKDKKWEPHPPKKRLWGSQRDMESSCKYCNIGIVPKRQDVDVGVFCFPCPRHMCPECKEERGVWTNIRQCCGCGDFDKADRLGPTDNSPGEFCFWCVHMAVSNDPRWGK